VVCTHTALELNTLCQKPLEQWGIALNKTGWVILNSVGPGDVVTVLDQWSKGLEQHQETSITFSSQLFEAAKNGSHHAYAVSYHEKAGMLNAAGMTAENRPKATWLPAYGVFFHLREWVYALSLLRTAITIRADAFVVDSGTTKWSSLWMFRLAGIKVIPNLHNTLWPVGGRPDSFLGRAKTALDGAVLKFSSYAGIGCSPETRRQFASLTGGDIPYFEYRAQFNGKYFEKISGADVHKRPFEVLFVGRLERYKGVFDIVEMAANLQKRRPGEVKFIVAGGGPILAELRQFVDQLGVVPSAIEILGRIPFEELLALYQRCNAVIVPTRADYHEGLAMVAAEGALAGRPVVSCALVPATEILRNGSVKAQNENIQDYTRVIETLIDDPALCEKMGSAGRLEAQEFLDRSRGIGPTILRAIENR
jgi:glycogen synthase